MFEAINTILTKIFGGGPESIIAILIALLLGAIYVIVFMFQDRQKQLIEQQNITEKYNEKLIEIIEKSHTTHSLTTQAIHEIRIVLAEIKAKQ
jgi:cell division protein FtsL